MVMQAGMSAKCQVSNITISPSALKLGGKEIHPPSAETKKKITCSSALSNSYQNRYCMKAACRKHDGEFNSLQIPCGHCLS